MTYNPPVKSMHYLLRHAIDVDSLMVSERYSDLSHDLISDILSGAAAFASDILAPLNWSGDQNPAKIIEDDVIASPGFKDAYTSWIAGGWQSLSIEPGFGGMGLPQSVNAAVSEMFYAANMAFGLCPMLTSSAIKAIAAHASESIRDKYLEKMVTGEWSGAMNLTEPQAGSDLGPIRTKAIPNVDGTYAITGQKIYITWGDHECTDNIVHLVLARLPDAPAGSKGISLFLCPKYFVNDDGSRGKRNNFKPISLEHKLGIHGSPTCVMEFEGATGWLVGERNRGLACMFTMMNEARLFVGIQGVGIGERAYQGALDFSQDRVQGRVLSGDADAPIIGHPDVRRMLIDMKARLMGARAICLMTAYAGDLAGMLTDEDAQTAAHAKEALLTPIAKAYGSDTGVAASSVGIQVHGGMGFVEETGAAQHYRDSRIAPIYEGTNGIQAIDLTGRKIRRDGGAAMQALIVELEAIADLVGGPVNGEPHPVNGLKVRLDRGIEALKAATKIILERSDAHVLSVATNYQKLCGDVIGGALLMKAAIKGAQAGDPGAPSMTALVKYHANVVIPEGIAQLDYIVAGESALYDFKTDALADL